MKGLENSLVQDLKITLLCNVQRSGVILVSLLNSHPYMCKSFKL